jgi:F-type H+-transporting ATPase subunit gamma
MIEKILNIRIDVLPQDQENADRYIFEPDAGTFLEDLIPAYLSSKITSIFLDAFNSEHQARAVAMGEATKNGTDLLTSLILLRNKVRQANITREIIEVISAAEALKG